MPAKNQSDISDALAISTPPTHVGMVPKLRYSMEIMCGWIRDWSATIAIKRVAAWMKMPIFGKTNVKATVAIMGHAMFTWGTGNSGNTGG